MRKLLLSVMFAASTLVGSSLPSIAATVLPGGNFGTFPISSGSPPQTGSYQNEGVEIAGAAIADKFYFDLTREATLQRATANNAASDIENFKLELVDAVTNLVIATGVSFGEDEGDDSLLLQSIRPLAVGSYYLLVSGIGTVANANGLMGSAYNGTLSFTFAAVPGPIAGAGLPALMALGGFLWVRRRKTAPLQA